MLALVFPCFCTSARAPDSSASSPAARVALANHPIVLMPLASESKSGLPQCEPRWQAWVPWPRKDVSMHIDSTNEAVMRFETKYIGNLGELEEKLGAGQIVELGVYSSEFNSPSIVLTVNEIQIIGYAANVVGSHIKSKSTILVVSTLESVFKFIGHDEHGNQFNTLHGGKVQWSFDSHVIQEVRTDESAYKHKYLHREYEDILVVRPKEEGKTELTAVMKCNPDITSKITLTVVRPIRFDPDVVYIVVGDTIPAKLFKGKQQVVNGSHQVEVDHSLRVTRQNSPEIQWKADATEIGKFSPEELSVTGLKKGAMVITAAHSEFPLHCNARLIVNVDYPQCQSCGLQYIQLRDDLPDDPKGNYGFGTKAISIGKSALASGKCDALVSDPEFEVPQIPTQPGNYTIEVCIPRYDRRTINCSVGVVERPYFTLDGVRVREIAILPDCSVVLGIHVPVGKPGFPRSSPNIRLEKTGTNVTIVGTAPDQSTLELEDSAFPGWTGQLRVTVCKILNLALVVPKREARVGAVLEATVVPDISCGSLSSKCVDATTLRAVDPKTNEVSKVLSPGPHGFRALSPGWANVYAEVKGVRSNVVLVHVFAKLVVLLPICDPQATGWLELAWKDGPQPWPNDPTQFKRVLCDRGIKFEEDIESHRIRFFEPFHGHCQLFVKNNQIEVNPFPIEDVANFTICTDRIARLGVIIHDVLAPDLKPTYEQAGVVLTRPHPCGYASFEPLSQWRGSESVAAGHRAEAQVVILKGNTVVSPLGRPDELITVENGETHKKVTYDLGKSRTVEFEPGASKVWPVVPVGMREDPPEVMVLTVQSVPLLSVQKTAWLWYTDGPQLLPVKDGSGKFEVGGDNASINGSSLSIGTSQESHRIVNVSDLCIPEGGARVDVATCRPKNLTLAGPLVGMVGQALHYQVTLLDGDGEVIKVSMYPRLRRRSSAVLPNGANVPFEHDPEQLDQYVLVGPDPQAKDFIAVELSVFFDNLSASLTVMVYRKPVCNASASSSNITWVGDRIGWTLTPSTCDLKAVETSSPSLQVTSQSPGELTAKATAAGNYTVNVSLSCPQIDLSTVCSIPVCEYYRLSLTITPRGTPFVGSYVIVVASLETSCGPLKPAKVGWTTSEPVDTDLLFDDSIAVHGKAPGILNLTARVGEPVPPASVQIKFDPKLEVLTRDLLLPQGTTFQLAVRDGLPVTYESVHPSVHVSETGVVKAVDVGAAAVLVRYESQLSVVGINVSAPAALYFERQTGVSATARLLDEDGQQYTARAGSSFAVDPLFGYTQAGDTYTFSVAEPGTVIRGAVTAGRVTRSHVVALDPGIKPWGPAVQRGVVLPLECASSQPSWRSTKLDVAVVTAAGQLTARGPGETVVACDPRINTTVLVFELLGLAIDRVADSVYAVRPLVFSIREFEREKQLHFPGDLTYRCEWDAVECGEATYGNGRCSLTYKTPRLCPAKSVLRVVASSKSVNLTVEASKDIVRSNPWGRTDLVARLPFGESVNVLLFGQVNKGNVKAAEVPRGIVWDLFEGPTESLTLRLSAREPYGENASVVMVHTETGEKVRILLSSPDAVVPPDRSLFWVLFAVAVALTVYIASRIFAPRPRARGHH